MGRASDPSERKREARTEATQVAAANLLHKMGVRLEQLDRWAEDPLDGETFLKTIQIKFNGAWDDDVLLIIRAYVGGEDKVAFHGGGSLTEALTGFIARLVNGSLKWKDDIPYDKRKGN